MSQDAIRLNKAGKPVPVDDLPPPPGFAPIPVGGPPLAGQPQKPVAAAAAATAAVAGGGAVAGTVPAVAGAPNPRPAVPAQKRGPLSQVKHSVFLTLLFTCGYAK